MVLKRDLMIIYEAATTGTSTAQIIDQQNTSSGMWAFREGLEVLFLVVLFYLLWPICFNAVGRLPDYGPSPKKLREVVTQTPPGNKKGDTNRREPFSLLVMRRLQLISDFVARPAVLHESLR